jgi:23S rRNA (guanosine2251-2'-O)-methyltransferase
MAVVVGPESTGLSPEEIAAADEAVRIPMQGSVESLNVAVATGIILYEANRQRVDGT